MNEDPLAATVAVSNAAGEEQLSNNFEEGDETSPKSSPRKCSNAVKEERLSVGFFSRMFSFQVTSITLVFILRRNRILLPMLLNQKPLLTNQKLLTKNQKFCSRNQKSSSRNQMSSSWNLKSNLRNQKFNLPNRKSNSWNRKPALRNRKWFQCLLRLVFCNIYALRTNLFKTAKIQKY